MSEAAALPDRSSRTTNGSSASPSPVDPALEWRAWRQFFRCVITPTLQYRARGQEHLPDGPALLIANHQSFLDPILIGLPLVRPVSFVARDTLFQAPIVGGVLRRTYAMPIRQESAASSIRVPIQRLKDGFYVGLFPEGARTEDGRLAPLRPGFAALLRRANAPVVPIGIAGAFEAYPRGAAFPRPGRVRVIFGKPVDFTGLITKGREGEMLATATSVLEEVAAEAADWRAAAT